MNSPLQDYGYPKRDRGKEKHQDTNSCFYYSIDFVRLKLKRSFPLELDCIAQTTNTLKICHKVINCSGVFPE